MLIWISAAPIPIGYTPTLLLTASPGRDGRVAFHDLPRLRALAGHHGGYLDQAGGPPG